MCIRDSSKVRKALPKDFAYVNEELITEKPEVLDKEAYYNSIVDTIISVGRAEVFIIALSELIQRLVIDHLHILGDIYDRGPGPDRIMDKLMNYHSLDIQWGNHDVVWMGAAAGQTACIATVLRNCARYGNLDILEYRYGINMLPLATLALHVYGEDPCLLFKIKGSGSHFNKSEDELNRKMHKAITIRVCIISLYLFLIIYLRFPSSQDLSLIHILCINNISPFSFVIIPSTPTYG